MVLSIYTFMSFGIDVDSILSAYGMKDIGTAVGTWAAAVTTSSILYPCTIACGGLSAPRIHSLLNRLKI